MDQTSITQNRRSARSPVLLSAKIKFLGVEVPVILRNLSSDGALIEGNNLPPEGTTTMFRRNDLSVKGRVVWVEGRYAGLAFDQRLERDELLRHVPSPRHQVQQQFRRPGFACQPLSEADRKMIQLWGGFLQQSMKPNAATKRQQSNLQRMWAALGRLSAEAALRTTRLPPSSSMIQ